MTPRDRTNIKSEAVFIHDSNYKVYAPLHNLMAEDVSLAPNEFPTAIGSLRFLA